MAFSYPLSIESVSPSTENSPWSSFCSKKGNLKEDRIKLRIEIIAPKKQGKSPCFFAFTLFIGLDSQLLIFVF